MNLFTGFAVYFVIWWITLFVVLPYGNRSQIEDGEVVVGTDPGAPTHARMWQKMFWNSIVAGIVFILYWAITTYLDWSFSNLPQVIPEVIN